MVGEQEGPPQPDTQREAQLKQERIRRLSELLPSLLRLQASDEFFQTELREALKNGELTQAMRLIGRQRGSLRRHIDMAQNDIGIIEAIEDEIDLEFEAEGSPTK